MPIKILMPALSPTMTEGNLAKWLKKEGDPVEPGDVIAEIETDKATMEYEAIDSGTMGKILVAEGTEGVAVNQPIAMLLEEGEDSSALDDEGAADAQPAPAPAASDKPDSAASEKPQAAPPAAATQEIEVSVTPLAKRIAAQAGVDLGVLEGSGAHGRIMRSDVEAALSDGGAPGARKAANGGGAAADGGAGRIFVSPLAARMAAEGDIPLTAIKGSGPGGRIVKADIEAALKSGVTAAAQAAKPAAEPAKPAAKPAAPGTPAEGSEVVKLSTMRKVIAQRMTESKTTVPHFYLTVDCEIDELLKMRTQLNKRAEPEKISVNDIVIRACALALREVPEANASYEGEGLMRKYHSVDISVAVAIPGGLITPIVRDADKKGFLQIAREMKDLAGRAKDGKLMPEEYQGGSFSISNLGMFGVKQFDAVINPPQACILAVGAGEPRPVVKDGEIAIATVMTCTLSVDHRVVDGAIGARLLAAIKRNIEYPPAMLL